LFDKRLMATIAILLMACVLFVGGCTTNGQVTTTVAGGDCDSRATPITSGVQVSGQMSPADESKFYCLYVPEGTSSITITLSDMTADLDLYVYDGYPEVPGTDYLWNSAQFDEVDEVVNGANPVAGHYYIEAFNFNDISGTYKLLATLT